MSDSKVSLSLAGCGFLGIYHIGVASCLWEHVPQLLENARIAGASAGALIACCIICKVPMNHAVDFTLRLARSSREFPLRGWEPGVHIEAILRSSIDFVLPANAHELCTNRLFVSVSCLPWCENKLISEFKTRQDLIDVLMCSAFVPAFSAYGIPKYKGEYLLDGGLSDNLPVFDQDTITISPWAGEHSICPRDPEGQSFPLTVLNMSVSPSRNNLTRFKDAFYSPTQETLKNYCWQGYDDALLFLSENQLIHCSNHRVLTHLTHLERRMNQKQSGSCVDCEHHRDHARNSQLSQDILREWETEESERAISYRSLVLAPVKKMINIWLIPIAMIKDYVLQIFLVAYFRADKIQKRGLSEDIFKLLAKLRNPKELMQELMVAATSKVVFSAIEYSVRVCSELFAMVGSLRFAKRIICREICLKCGHRVDQSPGALKQQEELQEDETANNASTVKHSLHTVEAESRPKDMPEIVVDPPASSAEPSTPEVAVWLDIKAQSVEMAIPIQSDASDEAEPEAVSEVVRVEAVGEIEEVKMDRVAVNVGDRRASMPSTMARESGGSREDRIHQYVHMFEQYKNVMTLHYMDENNIRHTESLFETSSLPVSNNASTPPSAAVKLGASPASSAGKEEDHHHRQKSGLERNVEKELKDLLEEKVLQPQREFEKVYQRVHQKRLKKKKLREVRKDTGHFSLQVISFREDLPSPINRRRNSLNLLAESNLVRSVSDACSLASSIRDFREQMPKEEDTHSVSERNLTHSKEYTSLQSLTEQTPSSLIKAKSDTSDVANSLQALRKSMPSTINSPRQSKTLTDKNLECGLPKVPTCPCLPSGDSAIPSKSASVSGVISDNSPALGPVSIIPTLPVIPDVLTPTSSDSDHEDTVSPFREPACDHSSNTTTDYNALPSKEASIQPESESSHSGSAEADLSAMASESHVKPIRAKRGMLTLQGAKKKKVLDENSLSDHATKTGVRFSEFHKSSTKPESPKPFMSPRRSSTPFSFHNIFRRSSRSNAGQESSGLPAMGTSHGPEADKLGTEGTSQSHQSAQSKLVRSHAVHKSKSEMGSLLASLKQLKSKSSSSEISPKSVDMATAKTGKSSTREISPKGKDTATTKTSKSSPREISPKGKDTATTKTSKSSTREISPKGKDTTTVKTAKSTPREISPKGKDTATAKTKSYPRDISPDTTTVKTAKSSPRDISPKDKDTATAKTTMSSPRGKDTTTTKTAKAGPRFVQEKRGSTS